MAGRDSTSEPAVPQARKSIVGYRPNGGRPNPLPQLTIKGRWLEQWGFVKASQSALSPNRANWLSGWLRS